MKYEVTKDISPFANKGKVWIANGEKVKEISREGNVSIVEYKNQRYPLNIEFLLEVKEEDPKEKPQPAAAEVKKVSAQVVKPITEKPKPDNSKQATLF